MNNIRVDQQPGIVTRDVSAPGNTRVRTSASIVEIVVVVFFYIMRYRISGPRNPSTGSVLSGQDLALAANIAYMAKYSDQASYRVYGLLEEDEAADNIVWQILTFIGNNQLDNLVIIFNVKRTAHSDSILFQKKLEAYGVLLNQRGFYSMIVNGDISDLITAYDEAAASSGKPTVIIGPVTQMRLDQLPVFRGAPTIEMPPVPTAALNPNAKGFCYIRVDPNTDIINLDDDLLQTGDAKVICRVEENEVVVAGVDLTLDEALALPELRQNRTRVAVTNPSKIMSLEALLKRISSITGTTVPGGINRSSDDTVEALCLAITLRHDIDYEYEFAGDVPFSGPQRAFVDELGICAAYVV